VPSVTAERSVLAVTYVVLAGIGVLSGGLEAFLVPQRLPHGVEGLSVVLAVVGNIGFGVLGGIGTKTLAGALVPAFGWFVTVGFISAYAPGGDVILPGTLPVDPGVTHVTTAFLILGLLASGIAVVLTLRYTKRSDQPTSPV
jgi:hypothetical protein